MIRRGIDLEVFMDRTTVISPKQVQEQLEHCRQVARLTTQWDEPPLAFVDTYAVLMSEFS